MNDSGLHPVELILIVLFVLLAIGIVIPFCVTFWREARQAVRDWRQARLQLRGPR
jgi:hypothetical protein